MQTKNDVFRCMLLCVGGPFDGLYVSVLGRYIDGFEFYTNQGAYHVRDLPHVGQRYVFIKKENK